MYDQYENAVQQLYQEIATLQGLDESNHAEYQEAREETEAIAKELTETWNSFSDRFRDTMQEIFPQEIIFQLIQSLNAYYSDHDCNRLKNQIHQIRLTLKDFRRADAEYRAMPEQPHQKPKVAPAPPPKIKTADRSYFKNLRFSEKFFPDKTSTETERRFTRNTDMIIMLESAGKDQEYFKVYLFNSYHFRRKSSFFGKDVWYEYIYKPDHLELASDFPVTDAIRKRVQKIFSAGASDAANDYGLHIRIFANMLRIELKRRGDMVSLNVSEHPSMSHAVHEAELPSISPDPGILRFEKILYFDTKSGQQNASAGRNADVKCTICIIVH